MSAQMAHVGPGGRVDDDNQVMSNLIIFTMSLYRGLEAVVVQWLVGNSLGAIWVCSDVDHQAVCPLGNWFMTVRLGAEQL